MKKKQNRILIVDDDSNLRTVLFRTLTREGFQALTAHSVQQALEHAKMGQPIDLALIDLRLPDGDGIELMKELKKIHPEIKVLILTGYASINSAVEATKSGAFHFITKPFNLDEIVNLAKQAFQQNILETENKQLRSAIHNKYHFKNIIGDSLEIEQVLHLVEKVAKTEATVLVTGESGTGKELIAKALHYNSLRSNKPFIPINCGAIPGELLESELFGHTKGAFTSSVSSRIGRFEMAHGGTIFLDEIGDMNFNLQVKLLRVLQEKCFEPVGGSKTIQSDVRIIAATNSNLEKAVKEGRFREDLFYRLNVIPIKIPSLRQRKSDIPVLINHFMDKYNKNKTNPMTGVTPTAMDLLFHYPWPGNVRELENLVERLSILKEGGLIDVHDLPDRYQQRSSFKLNSNEVEIPESGMDFNSAIESYENAIILKALERTGWNRNQAAILLKLNRTTLVEKIKKKGLKPPESNA